MTSRWWVLSAFGVICGCGSDDGSRHILDAPNTGGSDASGPHCPGVFTDDFSQGLRPALWTTTQTTADLFSVTAAGGVHLAKVMPSPGGLQNVSVVLDVTAIAGGPIEGDFTLSVDFANAVIGPSEDQAELHPLFADNSVFFDVYSNHGGAGPELHVWDGTNVNGGFATSATAGTLTIARAGGTTLIGTAAIAGADMPIYAGAGTASPLINASINLQLQPGSDDPTSIDFSKFSLGWTCP